MSKTKSRALSPLHIDGTTINLEVVLRDPKEGYEMTVADGVSSLDRRAYRELVEEIADIFAEAHQTAEEAIRKRLDSS